jgi:hypothetical protein
MSALKTIQAGFEDYVLGKAGAAPAIAASITDQYGLDAGARLAIYYNAYRIRMREALAEAYDKTWTYVGDELFEQLALSYLAAHPSNFRNLRWFGGRFAAHAAQELADYPWIADLAALEWALGVAFDAPDADTASAASLREVAPDDWAGLSFGLHPSVQLVPMRWNAAAIWQALHDDAEPPDAAASERPVTWLVWRAGLQPHFRSLDALEADALRHIGDGAVFGEVCETAAADGGADLTLRVAGCLQNWLAQGLLTPPACRNRV